MPPARPLLLASLAAVCLCVVAGCGGAAADDAAVVSDSAGVRLVANRSSDSWRGSEPWTATVDLSIGADSGAEAYQFGRIGDLAVTAAGEIVVIDQLAGTVRVFSAQGNFVRAVGGPGRGPGELSRSANGVFPLPGDTLLVADPGERRLTKYAPDGSVAATMPLPPAPRGQGWTRLPDGRFLMRGLTVSQVEGRSVFWDALLRVSADGSTSDTLMEFDYAKTDMGGAGGMKIQLLVNNPSWARLPDGRIAWTALDRDYLAIHDSTGTLVSRISHADWQSRPVMETDKTAMVELLRQKFRMIGGDASFADSPQVTAPVSFPAITAVRAGPDGTIWVQLMGAVETIDPMAMFAPDRADFLGGQTWHVLDRDGVFLGTIEMPPRFRIFRIVDDAIYGAARDSNDVERILRLRLTK